MRSERASSSAFGRYPKRSWMALSSSKITMLGLAKLRRGAQKAAHFQELLPRILGGKPPVVNSEIGWRESGRKQPSRVCFSRRDAGRMPISLANLGKTAQIVVVDFGAFGKI